MYGISSQQQLLTPDSFVLVTEFRFSFYSHSHPAGVPKLGKDLIIRGRKNTSSKWVPAPKIQKPAAAWGDQQHLLPWVPALDHHKVQAQLTTAGIKPLGKHPGFPRLKRSAGQVPAARLHHRSWASVGEAMLFLRDLAGAEAEAPPGPLLSPDKLYRPHISPALKC